MQLIFGNPWVLWALPSATVPFLLHLWSHRRYIEEPWGAMEFLTRAIASRARRVRLVNLLLVVLRTLAIVLLVLGFADPQWQPIPNNVPSTELESPERSLHVLVFDSSFSMQAGQRGDTSWDRARAAGKMVLQQSNSGDAFLVVMMASQPDWIVREPSFSPDAIGAIIDELIPGDGTAAWIPTAEQIERRFDELHHEKNFDRRLIHWFSDLQQATWETASSSQGRKVMEKLGRRAMLVVHPTNAPPGPNLLVSNLIAEPPFPVVGESIDLSAQIENHSQTSAEVQVSFTQQGRLIDRQTVQVAANGRTVATSRQTITHAGDLAFEVKISDDVLSVDNHRYLVVPAVQVIKVICFEGLPKAAQWLSLALTPDDAALRFDVSIASSSEIATTLLAPYDVAILVDPGSLSKQTIRRLTEFLETGKGIVLSLGSNTNILPVSGSTDSTHWIPADLLELAPVGDYRINPLDYSHPVLSPFRGNEASGLLTLPIWEYVRVRIKSEASVAAAMKNGDPLIIEGSSGAGRVLLVTTALEGISNAPSVQPAIPWSPLTIWPSFVPLAQSLVRVAATGRAEAKQVTVDEPLSGVIHATAVAPSPELVLPDGKREHVEADPSPPYWKWNHPGSRFSGWCRLHENEDDKPSWLAVNVDVRESQLQWQAPKNLPSGFTSNDRWQVTKVSRANASKPLFRVVLLILLTILSLESCVTYSLSLRDS